jgi:membrane protease YdiL (CAAX protease family)
VRVTANVLPAAGGSGLDGYFGAVPAPAPVSMPVPAWGEWPVQPRAPLSARGLWRLRESESGVGWIEGTGIAALALCASLVLTLAIRDGNVGQIDHAIRTGLFVTLTFYIALGALLAWYVTARRVKLVWSRVSAGTSVRLGIIFGVCGGVVGITINSLHRGHVSGDAASEVLVGGGGVLRIGIAIVIASVLAPLVEETLFRGVCAGSVLARGPAAAIWTSSVAFAVWHMMPSQIPYYATMGVLLAGLWRRHGLLASMTAHAAFNAMLTAAAIAATTGVGQHTQFGELSFQLPGGWHKAPNSSATQLVYSGPGAAGMLLTRVTMPTPLTGDQLVQRLRRLEGGDPAMMTVQPGTEMPAPIAGGEAATADITTEHQPGHILSIVRGNTLYTVVVVTSGSPKAEKAWPALARSFQLP